MLISNERRFLIAAAIDRTEYAEIVLEHAIDQAARHERCDLHFIRVVADKASAATACDELVTIVKQGLGNVDAKSVDWRSWVHVLTAEPWEIAELAADLSVDLLVIGRFGVTGAVAESILEHAPCPTLVVNLKNAVIEAHRQCEDCVAVRARTNGEQLFCERHAANPQRIGSIGPMWSSSPLGGLLL